MRLLGLKGSAEGHTRIIRVWTTKMMLPRAAQHSRSQRTTQWLLRKYLDYKRVNYLM